ncbi:calcineurin B homologous protein 1-like [Symsagittifera roscoffensis]|uniref:calcineurin B homologous protein 1-like n=1 Tax=Symsagittifera roscoffensis TaxID=84072 RepID=UPI00307CB29C
MGSRNSCMLQPDEILEIKYKTSFTEKQIERLYSRFTALDKEQKGFLTKNDLLRIPELSINPLGERIVDAFFVDVVDEQINFQQFMQTLAVFRPIKHKERKGTSELANSLEKKLEFAFRVYDVDNDGTITQSEIVSILHMMVGDNISEEQLNSIAHRAVYEVIHCDENAPDRQITFEQFKKALENIEFEQKMSIRFLH